MQLLEHWTALREYTDPNDSRAEQVMHDSIRDVITLSLACTAEPGTNSCNISDTSLQAVQIWLSPLK
jgi:hypothetical protein